MPMSLVEAILWEKKGWLDEKIWAQIESTIQYTNPARSTTGKITSMVRLGNYSEYETEMTSSFYLRNGRTMTEVERRELDHRLGQYLSDQMKAYVADRTIHRGIVRFYPVGQGLMCGIYLAEYKVASGAVKWTDYVLWAEYQVQGSALELYDCGSTTNASFGKKEIITVSLIEDCKAFLVKKVVVEGKDKYQINNVYLSHFDFDHVNGMQLLLHPNSPFSINTVTYHYALPMQQLGQVLLWGTDWQEKEELLDPREFLLRTCMGESSEVMPKVKNIVELHPWDEGEAEIRERQAFVARLLGNKDAPVRFSACTADYKFNGIAEYALHDTVWRRLLLAPVPKDKASYEQAESAFVNEMKKIIPDYETMTREERRQRVRELLKVPEFTGWINEIYRGLFGDPNRASMCLAISAQGINWEKGGRYDIAVGDGIASNQCKWSAVDIGRSGVLLTGDTELQRECGGTGRNWAYAVADRLWRNGIRPGCILLPHHGSENNIDQAAFDCLMTAGTGTGLEASLPVWVVSYGFNYRFGHPHITPCQMFSIHVGTVHQTSTVEKAERRFNPSKDEIVLTRHKLGSDELDGRGMLFHCRDHTIPGSSEAVADDRGVAVIFE